MTPQEQINALAERIATSVNATCLIQKRPDGSIDCVIKQSHHGNIGLCTDNNEITVYGFGCHQHFSSSTNASGEVAAMAPQISGLILGMLHGDIVGYGAFCDDMTPLSGGFGTRMSEKFRVHRLPADAARVTIRMLDAPEMIFSAKDIAVDDGSL